LKKWPFWAQNHWLTLSFLGNIGQENVFYDILERKNAYLGYKKISPKSRKTDISPKGLNHGFGPKMAIYIALALGSNQLQSSGFESN